MAEQDLPEGTDTVIAGASRSDNDESGASDSTTTSSSDSGASSSSSGASSSGSSGSSSSGSSSSSASAIMDKVRSGSEKLSGQAAGRAKDFLSQGIERSAETLANIGKLVGDTASGIDERLGEDYGNYARRAAETIEGAANSLASKDPDELIDDTREFIRRSPAVALAGAAIVGFAVARLIKSGLSSSSDDREDRTRS